MKKKVLVISGATGVGKTSCSIDLAKQFQGEIINGDAMQVYQGLDIGTAKITKEEMEGISHHLIDCFPYTYSYNVKIFQEMARAMVDEITARGHLPIVCGGTGLYIKSLLYDYTFEIQEKDKEFLSFLSLLSNAQLYAILTHVDKGACETIHPHNRQRLIRAIEMAHSGKRKSDVIRSQAHEMLYDAYIIGLDMDRTHLYERIDKRVEQMIKNGLYEEVSELLKQDPQIWARGCFQSIGYKEWKDHFQNGASMEDCIKAIQKNTRNFAKRQYTWFRNQLPIHWYNVEESDWRERLLADIRAWKIQ